MSENKSPYIKGSVVNSVAHQNLLALRQREADKHWEDKAKEIQQQEKKGKRRAPRLVGERKESRAQKLDRIQEEKLEREQIQNKLVMQFISTQREKYDWTPGSDKPLPHPKSQEDFAAQAGIEFAHYKELEGGRVAMTLDDAVKIARAYNVDMSTLLLPDVDNLEKSDFFDLEPIHPTHGPIYMYEWVLWIHGFRPLPGQNEEYFRNATALPKHYFYSASGIKERDIELRQAELKRRKESAVSAYLDIQESARPKTPGTANHPFLKKTTNNKYSTKLSHQLIKATLTVAARTKIAFSTDKGKDKKTLGKRFTDSVSMMRDRIVFVVETLISLGK